MRINAFLPLSLGLIIILEGALTFCIIFAAALLHELGHYFFIRLCGAEIKRIDIEVLGALIVYSDSNTSLNEDIAISAGGILFNLTAAVTGITFFIFFYNIYLFIFIAANLALAFVNLLPVESLDGGRVLSAILLKKYDIDIAERVSRHISFASKILLLVFSAFLVVISGYNTAIIILLILNLLQMNN